MARAAIIFGQFGVVADPVNLPHFRDRLNQAGLETILVEHNDSKSVYDFLYCYNGKSAIIGASLGAGAAPLMAGYLRNQTIDFVGGFQPSDWDPVMHSEVINGEMLRCVTVPANVRIALCFRNSVAVATGGLGHAIYVAANPHVTELEIIDRPDVHPGDFGVAQDYMVEKTLQALK